MKIKVLFFGVIGEITQKQEEIFDNIKNTQEFIIYIENKYPKLKDFNYQLSVNQSIIISNEKLNDNDELALLPPFAGG